MWKGLLLNLRERDEEEGDEAEQRVEEGRDQPHVPQRLGEDSRRLLLQYVEHYE